MNDGQGGEKRWWGNAEPSIVEEAKRIGSDRNSGNEVARGKWSGWGIDRSVVHFAPNVRRGLKEDSNDERKRKSEYMSGETRCKVRYKQASTDLYR